MRDPAAVASDTGLTPRQIEVLSQRRDGLTQREIAEQLETTPANISAVERAGRENIERARRTLGFAYQLESVYWFRVSAGTHLRDVIETVYEHADSVDVKITYSHPELSGYFEVHLADRLSDRRLADPIAIGITEDGGIVAEPPRSRLEP